MDPCVDLADITSVRIHPAIGIARLGNSPDAFFVGPEVPGAPPDPGGGRFKDEHRRIKRQAARFRCFGYDARGERWMELTDTPGVVAVHWTVHVVNRKGASLRFTGDTPRNKGAEPGRLVIDPGARTLRGPGERHRLDGGAFAGVDVPLGEVRTDEQGRLLLLGGSGAAGSPTGAPCDNFADNDGWYDDTCDGPVEAVVHIRGRDPIRAERAWVVVAPPKYAPGLEDAVTVWDLLTDLFAKGPPDGGRPPSYVRDIEPVLRRARTMGAVNRDAGGRNHARWPEPLYGHYGRRKIVGWLRPPGYENPKDTVGNSMPKLAGKPRPHLTRGQYAALVRWRDGDFVRDWEPGAGPGARPGAGEQEVTPYGLDRAALEACVGTVFEPGIEAGRFFLNLDNWADPYGGFRFHPRTGPGDVTARMAVPWQADFYACGAFWWPVSRPNEVVVPGSGYQGWQRGVANIRHMVDVWDRLGFVVHDPLHGYVEAERDEPTDAPEPPLATGQWNSALAGPGPGGNGHAGIWQQAGHLAGADLVGYGRGELPPGAGHLWPLRLTEADRSLTLRLRTADPNALSVTVRTPYGAVLEAGDPRLTVARECAALEVRCALPLEVAPQRFAREGLWEVVVRATGAGPAAYQFTAQADSDVRIGIAPDGSTIAVEGGRVSAAVLSVPGDEPNGTPLDAVGESAFALPAATADGAALRLTVSGVSELGFPFTRDRFLPHDHQQGIQGVQ